MRRVLSLFAWAGLWICLNGNSECAHNQYSLELKADGEGLQRKLTCTRVGGEEAVFDAEEATRLGKLYTGQKVSTEGDKHIFAGRFTGDLPADVGGSGRYIRFASRMGTSAAYLERFRGRDDLGPQLQEGFDAADRGMELLIGWAGWNLGEHPGWGKLRSFLDTKVRADLKSLLVYLSTSFVLDDYNKEASKEMGVRVIQFLLERGYFTAADLPRVAVAFQRDEITDPGKGSFTMALVQRRVADELGLAKSDPLPKELAFLVDTDKADESLKAYLKTTPSYLKRAAVGKAPEASELLDEVFKDLLPFELFATADEIEVSLACPVQPYETNGKWDAATLKLAWEQASIRQRPKLPTFIFASWSEPALDFQKKHFGRVVLEGQDLGQYNLWVNGLTPAEAKAWSAFVDGLKPGKKLGAQLAAFRFAGEKGDKSLAELAVDPILKTLSPAKAEKP
jgi:hypothetical protein